MLDVGEVEVGERPQRDVIAAGATCVKPGLVDVLRASLNERRSCCQGGVGRVRGREEERRDGATPARKIEHLPLCLDGQHPGNGAERDSELDGRRFHCGLVVEFG